MATSDTMKKVVDIQVNYENAVRQLAQYKATILECQEAEKKLMKERKDGNSSPELLKQITALQQNAKATKDSMRLLEKSLQNTMKKQREDVASLSGLRAELSKVTQAFDRLSGKDRAGKLGQTYKTQINAITTEIKKAEEATQRFYRNVGNYQSAVDGLKKIGDNFKSLKSIVLSFTGAMSTSYLGQSIINTARNYQDAMARVRAVSNPALGDFQDLCAEARRLGATTQYTAEQVGNAMEDLARKGFTAKENLNSINPVLKMAQANSVDMADAAQVASSSLRAFGMDASQMTRVTDVLSAGCANSATNIQQLGEAMKVAGPTARVANVSLEETVAMIGSLANIGMTGSDAGTGVKQIMMALTTAAHAGTKAQATLKQYNLNISEARIKTEGLFTILKEMKKSGIANSLEALKMVSGKYASPRLANIIKSIDETDELKKKLETSVGENDRMFEDSLSETTKAVKTLQSAWQELQIAMYDGNEDHIVGILQSVTSLLQFISKHLAGISQWTVSIIGAIVGSGVWKIVQRGYASAMAFGEAYREKEIKGYADAKAQEAVLERNSVISKRAVELAKLELVKAETAEEVALEMEKNALIKLEDAKAVGADAETIAVLEDNYLNYCIAREEAEMATQEKIIAVQRAAMASNGAGVRLQEQRKQVALLGSQMSKSKSIIVGAWRSIGAAIKSVLPLLILTAVIEMIQGAIKLGEILIHDANLAESVAEDIQKSLNEVVSDGEKEDRKLRTVRELQSQYKQIYESQSRKNKLTEAEAKQVQAICARMGIQNKEIGNLNKSLKVSQQLNKQISDEIGKQIKQYEYAAQRKAMLDLHSEAISTIMRLSMETGAGYETDPDEAYKQASRRLNKDSDLWDIICTFFGGEDNAYYKQHQLENAYEMYKQTRKYITANPDKQETPEGAFQPWIDPGKKKKDKTTDYLKQIEELIASLKKRREDKSISVINDSAEKTQAQVVNQAYDYLLDVFKKVGSTEFRQWFNLKMFQGAGSDPERADLGKTLLEQLDTSQDIRGSLLDALDWVKVHAKDRYKELLTAFSTYIPAEIADAVSKASRANAEWNIKALQSRLAMAEARSVSYEKNSEEEYANEQTKLAYRHVITDDQLEQTFVKGEFGTTYADKYNTKQDPITDSDRMALYNQYLQLRKTKEELYGDDQDQLSKEIATLDGVYKAEAMYYYRRLSAQKAYEQESRTLTQNHLSALAKDQQLAMQTFLTEQNTAHAKDINMRTGYYDDLGQGSTKYWKKVEEDLGEHEARQFEMRQSMATAEVKSIEDIGKLENETQEEYENRLATAKENEQQVYTDVNDAIMASDQARMDSVVSLMDSSISLMDALSEKDKDLAKVAKVITLARIAFATGQSIANVVAEASKVGFPAAIPIIVGGVATVMSNIASAISTVNSAKFATGGKVNGAGTGTSDSIPAQLSNGEFVMTAKATKLFEPLMWAMNAIGDDVALPRNNYATERQSSDLADSFRSAVKEIRPQVDVREITRTQNRVKTIQNLNSI